MCVSTKKSGSGDTSCSVDNYRVAQIKIPTGQNAISRQQCEIFIPKFLGLYGRDPATILKFLNLKNI